MGGGGAVNGLSELQIFMLPGLYMQTDLVCSNTFFSNFLEIDFYCLLVLLLLRESSSK